MDECLEHEDFNQIELSSLSARKQVKMRANMPQQGTSLSKINMRICTHVMEFPGCEQKFDFHFNKKPEDEKKDK